MAVFTTADRDAVKAALITAATTGFASVSIGGQAVQSYALDQLRALLKEIQNDLAGSNPHLCIRGVKTVPGGAG
jgi:hypothetical protein